MDTPADTPPKPPASERASNRRLRRLVALGAIVIALALVVRTTALSGGEDQVPWHSDHAAAAEIADASDRPMLLYFGAEWCGACRHLERFTFSREAVAKRIEGDFVPLKVDVTDPGPYEIALAQRYAADAWPTLVLTDAQGQMLDKRVGTMPARALLDWLDTAF